MPNIHNGVWCQHVDLHQIDERRPTSQKHRARAPGHGAGRIRWTRQPFKGEGVHERTSFASTCLTAATMFGYAAWGWLLSRHPAVSITPMALLVPVFGMGASALWLDEALPPWKIGAAGLVMSGLALGILYPRWRARIR